MVFMKSKNIIYLMLYVALSSQLFVTQTSAIDGHHDPKLLDTFVHDYAEKVVKRPRTGTLYNISLPYNFSGIEVSFVRLRSGSLRNRGRNSSLFLIPPRIIPLPYVKRLDIVYQNLGNWSSIYYSVPNYTFVTPVIGFNVYGGDTNLSSNRNRTLTLSLWGDPILIRFPNVTLEEGEDVTKKCVMFSANGTFQFSNVIVPNLCNARDQGHFSIVVPFVGPNSSSNRKSGESLVKWWIVVGVGGVVVLVLVGFLVFRMVRVKRMTSMMKKSEKSEALDIVWVGRSRMPSTSGVRTQPVLENDYTP